MALGNIDFSPLRSVGKASLDVAKNYNPVGSVASGILKGIDLKHSLEKASRDQQDFEMRKEEHKRKGTLHDLDVKVKEAAVDEIGDESELRRKERELRMKATDAALEDLPKKIKREKEKSQIELDTARTNLEAKRVELDAAKQKAKKVADDMSLLPEMTAGKYEEAGGLARNLHASISAAPDDDSKRMLVERANNIIGSHPILSRLYPDPITADDKGIEMLEYHATLFEEQADLMTSKSTYIDEATGNLMGFDKSGNPKLVKTADQLAKMKYNPTPVDIGDKSVKDNRRSVAATLDKLQEQTGVDYEIPGLSDREVQERVTAQYLGILAERKRLNSPAATMEEMVDEAFDLAFPQSRFAVTELEDGRKKAVYNAQAPIASGMLVHNGKSEPVEIMGKDNSGNYIVRQPGTGKQKVLTQAQYDAWFRGQN